MTICRSCGISLSEPCIDLGLSPVSNHLVSENRLSQPDPMYPLQVRFCPQCYLAQIDDPASREAHFSEDYVYFSSVSSTWLAHAKHYSEKMIKKLGLDGGSFVTEIASNDGYLLRYFVAAGIPSLGIEPTLSTAQASEKLGVECWTEFFGVTLAQRIVNEKSKADLIVANNVLAHVPDVNDFVAGLKLLLAEQGTLTIEFPHLLSLIENKLFDTIYHEHYCYFSLLSASALLARHGLKVIDVELLTTHGGSYRLIVQHERATTTEHGLSRVQQQLEKERAAGLTQETTLCSFASELDQVKEAFLDWLNTQIRAGKRVFGYGAAAKATTLLNYCDIGPDKIEGVFDASPSKQSRFIPGCRIPILAPELIAEKQPDLIVIFPWNITQEILTCLTQKYGWQGTALVVLPELKEYQV